MHMFKHMCQTFIVVLFYGSNSLQLILCQMCSEEQQWRVFLCAEANEKQKDQQNTLIMM